MQPPVSLSLLPQISQPAFENPCINGGNTNRSNYLKPIMKSNTKHLSVRDALEEPLLAQMDQGVVDGLYLEDPKNGEVPTGRPDDWQDHADELVEDQHTEKRRVHWVDDHGKEIAEVKTFVPSEKGDTDDDNEDSYPCTCVIQ